MYRYGTYHIDMVILDIDMGYGLVIWEITVSIRSPSIHIDMGYVVTLVDSTTQGQPVSAEPVDRNCVTPLIGVSR